MCSQNSSLKKQKKKTKAAWLNEKNHKFPVLNIDKS